MVLCWAPGCNHYNSRETCRFFKFPKDPKVRNKWIKLVRRGDTQPGPGAFLCSCHFPEGNKENLPIHFEYNKNSLFSYRTPERKKKRHNLEDVEDFLMDAILEKKESDDDVSDKEMEQPELPERYCSADDSQPSTSKGASSINSDAISDNFSKETVGESSTIIDAENYFLRQENERLRSQGNATFSFTQIEGRDDLCKLYTGLPTVAIFLNLYDLCEDIPIRYYFKWNVEKISKMDQLFLCLMKLRQNFPHADLAERFKISQGTVSNIVITWVHVLHEILFKQLMANVPSRRKNQTCLPSCFSTFTNCRMVLDCTEIAMTVPRTSMCNQKATYSSYKHMNTWKALVGVAPNGVITYVSSLYPGSTSDKKIVQHCGVLTNFQAGDLILADKGFLLKDILPAGVHLNIPPFLSTAQFTPSQVKQTETIARARVHVERAIHRMKLYKILSFIPRSLFEHAGAIVQVVGALTNLNYPLINEVRESYSSDSE